MPITTMQSMVVYANVLDRCPEPLKHPGRICTKVPYVCEYMNQMCPTLSKTAKNIIFGSKKSFSSLFACVLYRSVYNRDFAGGRSASALASLV